MPLCMHNSVMLTLLTARQNLPTAQQFFLSIDFSQLSLFGYQQAKHLEVVCILSTRIICLAHHEDNLERCELFPVLLVSRSF